MVKGEEDVNNIEEEKPQKSKMSKWSMKLRGMLDCCKE